MTLKLTLAYYLEENGDLNTSYALRWCVAHDRWPRVTKSLMMWATDPSQQHPGKRKDVARSMLPLIFFIVAAGYERCNQLHGSMSAGIAFFTRADAINHLGEILARLRGLTELTPPA